MKYNRKYPKYYTTRYKFNIVSNVIQELVTHCVKTKRREDQMTLVNTQGILNSYLELIKKEHENE